MAFDLSQIKTIVLLMFENRSFDHVLGHLSLGGYPVDGLRGPIDAKGRVVNDAYANSFQGSAYYPFRMADGTFPWDVPHKRPEIEGIQLATSPITGRPTMRGFVQAYYSPTNPNRTEFPEPMGFLDAKDVPVTSFLAREYAVCDRWFCSVPGDTQANRLMSLSGFTKLDRVPNPPILPNQPTFLDWLGARHIRWRVYRDGLSFLTLMPQYLDEIATNTGFRSVSHLANDVLHEPDATFPQVLVIEPSYSDSPKALEDPYNDNHPPIPMAPGEAYLKRIYEALSASPRWQHTLFVVTYDEHGGLFDHVPPPRIGSPVPTGATYTAPFKSLGVRVPSLVLSPFVKRGTVCSELLDHTSFLQLLAEKFAGDPSGYSPEVSTRRVAGIRSVSAALSADPPRADIPAAPPAPPIPSGLVVPRHNPLPPSEMQLAFAQAAKRLSTQPAAEATHPGITAWAVHS